jgi:hypothetical protein
MLTLSLVVATYFGAYFLAADYVDVGDNNPMYLLRYRIGSHSLQDVASAFEPARWIDESLLRRRHATLIDFRLEGEPTR